MKAKDNSCYRLAEFIKESKEMPDIDFLILYLDAIL